MTKPQKYWDEMEDKYGEYGDNVKCRICGKVFVFLGAHIKAHNLSEMEYKDRFSILHGVPLCVDELSETYRKSTNERIKNGALGTPEMIENLLSSSRNTGISQNDVTKKHLQKINIGKIMTDESKEKMRNSAKKRTPQSIEKMRHSLVQYQESRRTYTTCDNCQKTFAIRPSKNKHKNKFCCRNCFNAWIKKNGDKWASHINSQKE